MGSTGQKVQGMEMDAWLPGRAQSGPRTCGLCREQRVSVAEIERQVEK